VVEQLGMFSPYWFDQLGVSFSQSRYDW